MYAIPVNQYFKEDGACEAVSYRRGDLILLGAAADDLDLVGVDGGVLHLEGDVLDQEGPDLVAEAVGVEVSLRLN